MPRKSQQQALKQGDSCLPHHWLKSTRDAVAVCLMAMLLAACGGGSGFGGSSVDDTLVTGDVAGKDRSQTDLTRVSDEATIRNAVSSVDLAAAGETELLWANVDTGSRGTITNVEEYDNSGLLCRKFHVSRESFDGVRLYMGDACRSGDGSWRMHAFVES